MKRLLFEFFALVLLVQGGHAQSKFAWQPVTAEDWAIAQDSAKKIRDAVMIFEKVNADETDLDDKECYLRTYRRIKILTAQGRSWADVTLSYDPETESIKEIGGRTLLPDGTVIELAKEKILEKSVVQTEDEEVREKSFSLPGVTDSCIIEYYYAYENEHYNSRWSIQKDIPLMQGEYRWKFYKPSLTAQQALMLMMYTLGFAPNYMLVNGKQELSLESLPSKDNLEEVAFRLKDVPPFKSEPFSLPETAAKEQLLLYYSSVGGYVPYWSEMCRRVDEGAEAFMKEADDLEPIVKELSKLTTNEEKISAAHRWLQEHVVNLSYAEKTEKRAENESVDDLLSHKYGFQYEINYTYQSILNALGIRSRLFYVARRDEHLFFPEAKFWQFERPIVGVVDAGGGITYCSPGDLKTAPGQIPWYYEGARGLLVGAGVGENLFIEIPKSPAARNTHTMYLSLELTVDAEARGSVREVFTGHEARKIRLLLRDKPMDEQKNLVKKERSDDFSEDWKDSIRVTAIEQEGDSVVIQYSLLGPEIEADATGKIIFHPYSVFAGYQNPFDEPTREHPIMFDNARILLRYFTIRLDKGLSAEVIPQPVTFTRSVGEFSLKSSQSADSIAITSKFQLKSAFYSPNLYDQIKALYQQRVGLKDVAVILKKSK